MNRWLIAVVMGLVVTGCAAGVEDPQPAPTPEPEQREPPAQTLSGTLATGPTVEDMTRAPNGAPVTNLVREHVPTPGEIR